MELAEAKNRCWNLLNPIIILRNFVKTLASLISQIQIFKLSAILNPADILPILNLWMFETLLDESLSSVDESISCTWRLNKLMLLS